MANNESASPYAIAIEQLSGFVDLILEAFHTGEGLKNNMPEPITIDVARRLIWSELRRVISGIDSDARLSLDWCLWLRIQLPVDVTFKDVYKVINDTPGVDVWNYRVYGPRVAGDPTVIYAMADVSDEGDEGEKVLPYLWEKLPAGTTIRDIQLGARM